MNKIIGEVILNLIMVALVLLGGWWKYLAAVPVWISFVGICLVAISIKNNNVPKEIYKAWGKKGIPVLTLMVWISAMVGSVFITKEMWFTGIAHMLSGLMVGMLYVAHFNNHDVDNGGQDGF